MKNKEIGQSSGEVEIVRATSTFDCGGRCPLRLLVKDNRIIRVEGSKIIVQKIKENKQD